MKQPNNLYSEEEGKEIFINAFSTSAEKNIKSLGNVDITLQSAEILASTRVDKNQVIYGVLVVPFKSIGNVTISMAFAPQLIFKIIEEFLNEKHNEINDDVSDAVGEITNLITVQAKTLIKEMGIDFSMTIPYVNFLGPDDSIVSGPHRPPVLSMKFESIYGELFIELSAKTSRISQAFKGPQKL